MAITGSVGKSTTKELIADVLNERYTTLKSRGNLNNEIGLPLSLLRLGSGYQRAVLEMGFYVPGEITFLCDLAEPQVGVITNIGTVHAERAGSQEEIARGKSELIQALPASPVGTAILNYDDPFVRPMADITRARVLFYGLNSQADLWADEIEGLGLQGIRFRLHHKNEALNLRVPLIGSIPCIRPPGCCGRVGRRALLGGRSFMDFKAVIPSFALLWRIPGKAR